MPLIALSTSDIEPGVLEEFTREMGSELDVAVNDRQILLRSAEPPSWIQFFAGSPWWIQGLSAYAALYVAELVKEAAKTTWKERAKLVSPAVRAGNAISSLARALIRLRSNVPQHTKLVLGLPVPDDYFGVRLELVGREEDIVAAEIAIFVRHLPALQELLDQEALPQGVLGAVNILIRDNGALVVAWMNRDLKLQEHVLPLK